MNMKKCLGCGLINSNPYSSSPGPSLPCEDAYHQLIAYTFSLGDSDFIHQLVVDAYSAQHANCGSLHNMRIAFGLIGLHLRFEQGYSGRQVQSAHRLLAEQTKIWPLFLQKKPITNLTVQDVILKTSVDERNNMIVQWGRSIWDAWADEHGALAELCQEYRTV